MITALEQNLILKTCSNQNNTVLCNFRIKQLRLGFVHVSFPYFVLPSKGENSFIKPTKDTD